LLKWNTKCGVIYAESNQLLHSWIAPNTKSNKKQQIFFTDCSAFSRTVSTFRIPVKASHKGSDDDYNFVAARSAQRSDPTPWSVSSAPFHGEENSSVPNKCFREGEKPVYNMVRDLNHAVESFVSKLQFYLIFGAHVTDLKLKFH
jgi:hypothetical protein